MSDFRQMLEEGYAEITKAEPMTRLAYLSDYIFQLVTYEAADLLANDALEVCEAINEGKTYQYIMQDAQKSYMYILLVNMPFFIEKIEWGISIRGAWWQEVIHFSSCGLWLAGKQVMTKSHSLTREEWQQFIAAMIEFGRQ